MRCRVNNAVIIHQSSYGFVLVSGPNDPRPEIYINKQGILTYIREKPSIRKHNNMR